MVPLPHQAFVDRALVALQADARLLGVAAAGSWIGAGMDEYSDVDLILAYRPDAYRDVMGERRRIADGLGSVLSAFTGEHVGEPRLLICLYEEPLLHVDLKFVTPDDLAARIEDPVVLWERGGALSQVMARSAPQAVVADAQWIEDRFWVWIHYTATKIGRGELFEALEQLGFLRQKVLGPLIAQANGALVRGIRRVERIAPDEIAALRATVGVPEVGALHAALTSAIELYRRLRGAGPRVEMRTAAEAAAVRYLDSVAGRERP